MTEYATINRLTKGRSARGATTDAEVAKAMNALAAYFKKGKQVGRFQIRVGENSKVAHYCFDLLAGDCKVTKASAEGADFKIAVSKETWAEIAAGELSPVDAFISGRMEVEGNLNFGRRLYAAAASKKGTTEI